MINSVEGFLKVYKNSTRKQSLIHISLNVINDVQYCMLHGVLIDKKLSWKHYIDAIATKISKNVGLIAKLRHYVPRKILLNFYKSLIHPYLTYGLPAWGQVGKMYLNKILILQKRALCLLFFADVRDHAIPLFLEANVLPITFLYHECVASLKQCTNQHVAFI